MYTCIYSICIYTHIFYICTHAYIVYIYIHTHIYFIYVYTHIYYMDVSSAQFGHSVVSNSATPWSAACQASLSITNFQSPPKRMSIHSVMPSNHLILCHPLPLPSVFPTSRSFQMSQLFTSGGQSIGFSFNISPSNEHSGPVSFRLDWLVLLAVQGTLKNLLQHHSSKASILQHSAFFIVQLSHSYMTTGETIALFRWTFVDKVMSLLFNMLSRLVITFLPRSKRLLISWLQSPSTVILEPQKIRSATVSPSICHEVLDQMPWSSFSECWALSQLFYSPLSLSSRGSLVLLHFLP